MTMYSSVFSAVAVTAQQDFFTVVAPAAGSVIIHRVVLSQSTDVGDAAEEGLNIILKRGTGTVTAGTANTPVALESQGPAYGGTVTTANTTKLGSSPVSAHVEVWNIRAAFDYLPTPETRLIVPPSAKFAVELATTPADSITVSGTCLFEWIG